MGKEEKQNLVVLETLDVVVASGSVSNPESLL